MDSSNPNAQERKPLIMIVDDNPHKQGFYTPIYHIPILSPKKLLENKIDYVIILPWNYYFLLIID